MSASSVANNKSPSSPSSVASQALIIQPHVRHIKRLRYIGLAGIPVKEWGKLLGKNILCWSVAAMTLTRVSDSKVDGWMDNFKREQWNIVCGQKGDTVRISPQCHGVDITDIVRKKMPLFFSLSLIMWTHTSEDQIKVYVYLTKQIFLDAHEFSLKMQYLHINLNI